MNFFNQINPFRKITAEDVHAHQLADAQRMALEHKAAAEHHKALAAMYAARAKRLREQA